MKAEITETQAAQMGYVPVTIGYHLPDETWMLSRVMADMRRLKTPFVLVNGTDGIQVWRM